MAPDLVFRRGGTPVVVADVKYKLTGERTRPDRRLLPAAGLHDRAGAACGAADLLPRRRGTRAVDHRRRGRAAAAHPAGRPVGHAGATSPLRSTTLAASIRHAGCPQHPRGRPHERAAAEPRGHAASVRGCSTTSRPRSRWPTSPRGWRSTSSSSTRATGSSRGPTSGCGCRSARPPTAGGTPSAGTRSTQRQGFAPYGHQAAAFARLSARRPRRRASRGRCRRWSRPAPARARPRRSSTRSSTTSCGPRRDGVDRDEGAAALPDERAGQRPGAAARRPDHRRTRRSAGVTAGLYTGQDGPDSAPG